MRKLLFIYTLTTLIHQRASFVYSTLDSPEFLGKQRSLNLQYDYARHIEATAIDFDNHNSYFYTEEGNSNNDGSYSDKADDEYKRIDFQQIRLTSVRRDLTCPGINSSVHPFVVGQKSLIQDNIITDRWDVKVNSMGHQFIGQYYGNRQVITNRMRSLLALWIANGFKDYLPILDATTGPLKESFDIVEEELSHVAQGIIHRLAEKVLDMIDYLEYYQGLERVRRSFAGGTIVMVTNEYLVFIIMGKGAAFIYDQSNNLIERISDQDAHSSYSYFIESDTPCRKPFFKIVPRRTGNDNYAASLLLVTPSVMELVENNELNEIIKGYPDITDAIDRSDASLEVVTKIINLAASKWGNLEEEQKNNHLDLSTMFFELKETKRIDLLEN